MLSVSSARAHFLSCASDRYLSGNYFVSRKMITSNDSRDAGNGSVSKRERGKLAQREYRKRHASRFQSLKDENARLKDAIRKLCKAASGDGNLGMELSTALSEAATVAGLANDEHPTPGGASSDRCEEDSSVHSWPSMDTSDTSDDQVSVSESCSEIVSVAPKSQQMLPSSGLRPPIWQVADRVIRIYNAPADVTPYLGDGFFTFSGCLYWATIYYAVYLWRKANRLPHADHSYDNRLDRMFNHKKRLNDRDFLMSVAQARVESKKRGLVERYCGEDLPADNWKQVLVYNRAKQQYEEREDTIRWWKSAKEVESYVLPHLSQEEIAHLQQILEGRGSAEALEMFAPLFEKLVRSFVCFKEGPRWNIVHVSVTVGAWLRWRRA
ncbi:hypothetical protein BGZ63DRAFT_386455 [Mariannaea sp. PMI_226]|nr:hypothetical protein BGZ63DRAFT_386455 [Mariannaea sp. PMI_226]